MSEDKDGMTRRRFMELSAVGATAAALPGSNVLASAPKRGGTVTCGMAFLIQTPDPHRYTGVWARQCMAPTWEGLTMATSLGERLRVSKEKGPQAVKDVQPMLAENWEIEKGGRRYVFYLKKGVKFHNGKELDSEDVKWSWERIKDPVHQSTVRKFITQYLGTVETPDKYTVVANMTQPYGAFLVANSVGNCSILPKDCIPHGAIWGFTPSFKPKTTAPPGTGPFIFTAYQQKYQAIFERFNDYHIPGLPYLDKLVYKVISKSVPRTMAMRAGNVDYIYGAEDNWLSKLIKDKPLNQVLTLEKEGLQLFPILTSGARTIYLNNHDQKDTPFKDVRVRRALNYCIDRKQLAKALMGNLAIPIGQGYHPDISPWGYEDIKPVNRDIEKAKKLLKEAGYPNGLDVVFTITPTWGKNDIMAQIVQQMAKPAGIRIKIKPQVGLQYWLNLTKYTYQMLIWGTAKEDPMQFYYNYLRTDPNKPYKGYSPALGVKDEVMDELLDMVAAEADIQKRRALFKKVVLRANEKAYWIHLFATIFSNAWSTKLKNFKPWDYFVAEQAFREAWLA